MNTQNLAIAAATVGRRALSIPGFSTGTLINRSVPLGIVEWVGVVAGGKIQITGRPKLQSTGMVTALLSLFFVFEQQFF